MPARRIVDNHQKLNLCTPIVNLVRFIVCISGASGSVYGLRLLQELPGEKTLVMSPTAKEIMEYECGIEYEEVKALADHVHEDDELGAPVASGSNRVDAVFIVPCSMSTVAKMSQGIADTLITRVASVALKEGRKLVIVPRETPKSQFMLENELRLARAGVTVLDASPAFYHRPIELGDLVDFVVGRMLDQLEIEHSLYRRWRD